MKVDLTRLRNLADLNSLAEGAQEDRVLMLDPDDIVVKKQFRRTFKGIEELAESMREQQQSPIIVSPLNKDTGKYLLQKGERRLRAAKLIGGGYKLRAIVDSTQRSASEHAASQMIENIQREDPTPIEIGRGLVEIRNSLIEEGRKGTGKELANLLKKPESWVSRHLALADVPEELAQLIEDEITTDSEIIYSLKQLGEIDPARFTVLIARARDPERPLSREEVRREMKAAKGAPELPREPLAGKEPGGSGTDGASQPEGEGRGGASAEGSAGGSLSGAQSSETPMPPGEPGATGAEGAGTSDQPDDSSKAPPKASQQRERATGKLGKAEVATITPERMVIAVRVALDRKHVTGELLLNKVCGDPSKGLVSILVAGRPTEKLVPLDQIELLSMMPLATD